MNSPDKNRRDEAEELLKKTEAFGEEENGLRLDSPEVWEDFTLDPELFYKGD